MVRLWLMMRVIQTIISSIIVGVSIGLLYAGFTLGVEYAQDLIWFDIAGADSNKIMALPVAIAGGLVMALVLKLTKQLKPVSLKHTEIDDVPESMLALRPLMMVLAVGFLSLVAGASLGPEAILLPVSFGIGYLLAKALNVQNAKGMGIISVIALLGAFMNSYFVLLLLVGLLLKKSKAPKVDKLLAVLAGIFAITSVLIVLPLVGVHHSYVQLQQPFTDLNVSPLYLLAAMVVAALAMGIPALLYKLTQFMQRIHTVFNGNWIALGLLSGTIVGLLYALMGPISYFSGSEGMPRLIAENGELTAFQLGGIFIGKLLVTAWSLATIYRGGIVFPQLLVATSMVLLLSGGMPSEPWLATLMVAAFFGVFAGSLGSIFIALAFVLALFGTDAAAITLAAMVGVIGVKTIVRSRSKSPIV